MKEIAFGNLGFSIVNSYKAMKSRIDNENEICLFNEFTATAVVYKSFWGAEIEFEIDNQDISTLTKVDDILIQKYPNVDIGGIVEIMLDAICSNREYLDINQDKVHKEVVKSRLLKLDSGHIDYVIECMQKNTTKIGNIRSYLLTTLYNSFTTQDHYYRAEVNYDFYGKT